MSLSAVIFMVLILGGYWIGFAVLLTIALRKNTLSEPDPPAEGEHSSGIAGYRDPGNRSGGMSHPPSPRE
jgi:hypothetical protein